MNPTKLRTAPRGCSGNNSRLRLRLPMVAGTAAAGAGLALNWDWLAAAGAAPFLLGALPCAAACALGLCVRVAPPSAKPTQEEVL